MAYMSVNSYLGLALQSDPAVAASGTFTYIPVSAPQVSPMLQWLRDEALRGSPVSLYDQVAGVRHDEVDFKTYAYADSAPLLFASVLGPITSSGSTLYTHVIGVLNSASTGSQTSAVTVNSFDGGNAFQISNARAASLDLSFGADKAVEASLKYMGQPWTTPTPTASYGTEALIPGWNTAISINSTSFANIIDGTVKIDRKTAPIFTAGTQGPHTIFNGPCDVSGSFTVVVEAADAFTIGSTAYGLYRGASSIPLTLTFTDNSDGVSPTYNKIVMQMSDVQFFNPKRLVGKDYVELTVDFDAQANTTDKISTGYSPLKVTVTNNVAPSNYNPS